MKLGKASALIYTREKYIGFPGGFFKVQPEDLPEQTAKALLECAIDAMDEVASLRSSREHCRAVIARDGYVVLGVAAYMRDLFSDGWEGKDKGGRLVHSFVGYVWKQADFRQTAFPEIGEFGTLAGEWIRPHWEDSPNSRWAEGQELVPYRYEVGEAADWTENGYTPARIESVQKQEQLLQWAMAEAVKGKPVSVCTNVTVYDASAYQTSFQYVAQRKKEAYAAPAKAPEKPETKIAAEQPKEAPQQPVAADEPRQEKKTENKKGVYLIAAGAAISVLGIAALPGAVFKGILWKLLLIIGIGCAAAGAFLLLKGRKQETAQATREEPVLQIKTITPEKPSLRLEPAAEPEKPPVKQSRPKQKEPETSEELFRM